MDRVEGWTAAYLLNVSGLGDRALLIGRFKTCLGWAWVPPLLPSQQLMYPLMKCRVRLLLLLSRCPFMSVCPGHSPRVSAQSGCSLVLGRRGEKSSVHRWSPGGGGGEIAVLEVEGRGQVQQPRAVTHNPAMPKYTSSTTRPLFL